MAFKRAYLRVLVVLGLLRAEFVCECGRMHTAGWAAWHEMPPGNRRVTR